MPRGFMNDLEGEVVDEKVHKSGLGKDSIFAVFFISYYLVLNLPLFLPILTDFLTVFNIA